MMAHLAHLGPTNLACLFLCLCTSPSPCLPMLSSLFIFQSTYSLNTHVSSSSLFYYMWNHISLFVFHQAIKWFISSFVLIFLFSPFFTLFLLGSEVDEPFKILIKTSNALEYIESYFQNTDAPRTNNPII